MNHSSSNMMGETPKPRVVVVGLASCFGCQVQLTNMEPHLLDVLGQIDLGYWQLASSDPMPESFDVAVIEGAVTTQEAVQTVKKLREQAAVVISMGSCATTGGIPGIAALDFDNRAAEVYGDDALPEACGEIIAPRAVGEIVSVDYEIRCCPVDPMDFVAVLQAALYGSNRAVLTGTLCGECKRNETDCFFADGKLCLGMVTTRGCGARCVSLGRPCNGCAGISPDANLASAHAACEAYGVSREAFDEALQIFNRTNPVVSALETCE